MTNKTLQFSILKHFYLDESDKQIESESAIAERATVEIINKFVELIEVKETGENGERIFQLPPSQQNESNFREELRKPIDKFDWISFPKVSRQVFFPESDRFMHCKILFTTNETHKCLSVATTFFS